MQKSNIFAAPNEIWFFVSRKELDFVETKEIQAVMKKNENRFDEFHAGHFLRDVMLEEGRDVAWLASRTGRDVAFLEDLLEQPNLDAELFVRMGMPMEPLFMQRVDEMIFGSKTTA